MDGPQKQSGHFGEEKKLILLPGTESVARDFVIIYPCLTSSVIIVDDRGVNDG